MGDAVVESQLGAGVGIEEKYFHVQPFTCLGFKGSGFSAAAGRRSGQFDQNRNPSFAGCIKSGSLLNRSPAIETADLIKIETSTCGVSYERRLWPEQRPVKSKNKLRLYGAGKKANIES